MFEGRYGIYMRYLVSGSTAAVVDLGLLYYLTHHGNLWYLYSAIIAFAASFVVSFIMQKFWTFRDKRSTVQTIGAQGSLYFLIALVNLGLNTAFMYVFVDLFELWYMFAQVLAAGLVAISSFFIYRSFVFHQQTSARQLATILWGTFKTILRSFSFLGLSEWFAFWFLSKEDDVVDLKGVKVAIRGTSVRQRVVDLFVATYCILDGEYNRPGFEIRETDTILDIGGHIGSFTLAAASRARQGKLFVFEPDSANYAQLRKNVGHNNFDHVTVVNKAVAGKQGERRFYRDEKNDSSSSFSRPVGEGVNVKTTTLKDIFTDNNILKVDFMKLDCEGSEYEIIFNTPRELFRNITCIAIEVHEPKYFNLDPQTHNRKKFIAYLEELGYVCSIVEETNLHDLVFARRNA